MANKPEVPVEFSQLGLLDIDDILADSKLLPSVPECFNGKDVHTIASIYFSSGTTGLSKAVGLTHYNINGLLSICLASFPHYVHGIDTLGVVVPLFHVLGGLLLVTYGYFVGVPTVIMPGFEPRLFLESIQKFRITVRTLLVFHPCLSSNSDHRPFSRRTSLLFRLSLISSSLTPSRPNTI